MGMREKLIEKLKKEIEKENKDEAVMSYILILIRKILETDKNLKNKYAVLKFYCDWSLHIEIDRINDYIKDKIIKPFLKDEIGSGFLDLNDFGYDFINFLKEFEIDKNNIYKDTNSILIFTDIIRNLLLESPLIIKNIGGKKITITNSSYKKNTKTTLVGFKIEDF